LFCTRRGAELFQEFADERREIEAAGIAGRVEEAMHRRERADALRQIGERTFCGLVLQAARLEVNEGCDHLEVVLDPVVDLVKERRLAVESRLQLAGHAFEAFLRGRKTRCSLFPLADICL